MSLKLNKSVFEERKAWENKGYKLPEFDREKVTENTKANPYWIHFGPGNIFRAFQANVVQNLLNSGDLDRGLVVAEGYDYEIVEKMNHPHDDLSILATLKADGTIEKTVVGSVVESLALDSDDEKSYSRLKEIFSNDSLQMASFTITEKGYSLVNANGEFVPAVVEDFENGPEKPCSYMGKVASLLHARYVSGATPIAMVSMDNCSHNGDKLKAAITTFADKWEENSKSKEGFAAWIKSEKVSFPWTMIDKITPRPNASVEELLNKDDIEGLDTVITSKKSYVAPFVNAEECEYLVIEDDFPNGRPNLEKGGLIFTQRETVDKVERMKVCTCLNPLHTALAVYGCIMDYELISAEMKNPTLKKMVEILGYTEGLPVVTNPGILDPKEFIDTVLNVRIPNPFMPDTPQRIATDTSQKLSIRFGETIKAYEASENLNTSDLKVIPLVFAGWLRYLTGIGDNGEKFELSPDPMLSSLCPIFEGLKLDGSMTKEKANELLKDLLSDSSVWGVDLYKVNMADTVCSYFSELMSGVGAVEATLKKYIG